MPRAADLFPDVFQGTNVAPQAVTVKGRDILGIPDTPDPFAPPEKETTLQIVLKALSYGERKVGVPLAKAGLAFVNPELQKTFERAETGADLFDTFIPIPQDAGVGRRTLQWLGEVGVSAALDPISYIPLGRLFKAGLEVTGGKAAIQAARARVAETAVGQAGLKAKNTVRHFFTDLPPDQDAARLMTRYRDLKQYRTDQEILKITDFQKEVQAVAERTGMPYEQFLDVVREGKEIPLYANLNTIPKGLTVGQEELPKVFREALKSGEITSTRDLFLKAQKQLKQTPEARPIVDRIKTILDEQLETEKLMGLKATELLDDVEYLPHVITDEVKKQVKSVLGVGREWTPTHQSELQRSLRGLTVSQTNEALRQGLVRIKGVPIHGEAFFETDPLKALFVRSIRHVKAITNQEFINDVQKMGVALEHLPKDYVVLPLPGLEKVGFDPEVARAILLHQGSVSNVETVNQAVEAFDRVQDLWKAWTLAVFPAYHSRNAISNLWNNFLGGVSNPLDYTTAMYLQNKGSAFGEKILSKLASPGLETPNGLIPYDTLVKEALERGVMGRGWYGGDIPRVMSEFMKKKTWWSQVAPGRNNAALNAGMRVGTAIENNARLAHFVGRLRQGDAVEDAALSVKKFLFDYGQISQFERNAMKRIIPFYTWSRKNIPLQLEMLVKEPRKFALIQKGVSALSGQTEDLYGGAPDERYMSDWMKENYPVRLRKNSNGDHEYFLLGSWLPATDVEKLLSPIVGKNWLLGSVTPLVSTGLELATNRNFFFNRDISRFEGDLRQMNTPFGPVVMGAKWDHALRKVRLLNEMDKAFDTQQPVSSRALRLLTGKLYPFDEEKSKQYYTLDIKREIQAIRSAAKKAMIKGQPALRDKYLEVLRSTFGGNPPE